MRLGGPERRQTDYEQRGEVAGGYKAEPYLTCLQHSVPTGNHYLADETFLHSKNELVWIFLVKRGMFGPCSVILGWSTAFVIGRKDRSSHAAELLLSALPRSNGIADAYGLLTSSAAHKFWHLGLF